jgi:superfamily II RNA helicase
MEINPKWETYFKYKLDNFQEEALYNIDKGNNVLVCAHTGSGKTTIGEYALLHHAELNNKVIYTSPIKALSNQIYRNLTEKYPNLDIGIHTGDIQINSEAQFIIMTTEILRNNLLMGKNMAPAPGAGGKNMTPAPSAGGKNMTPAPGAIIFDEVHYIKDKDRGHIWEQSIISADKSTQLILLSATLPNPEKFAKWVTLVNNKPTAVITTYKRIVPLTYYIFIPKTNNMVEIMDNTGNFNEKNYQYAMNNYEFRLKYLNEIMDYFSLNQMLPALFFCFSRQKCEKYSRDIIPLLDTKDQQININYFDFLIAKYKCLKEEGLEQVYKIRDLIGKGVCYHHSGIHPILKEIIETMFSKNMIKVLFATETFAVGINMPSKTVIFTGLSKYTDNNFRQLLKEEFQQMAGRAGRRGIDTKGNVVIMPFEDTGDNLKLLKSIINNNIAEIKSQFKLDVNFILKKLGESEDYYKNSIQYEENLLIINRMVEELNGLVKYNTIDISKYTNIIEYLQLKGNAKKKFDLQMRRWEKDEINTFMYKLEHYKQYELNNNKISALKADINNNSEYNNYIINKILYILKCMDYIGGSLANNFGLTKKGEYAQQINECNPILLIEIVYSNILNDLEFEEIVAILAIFLDIKREMVEIEFKELERVNKKLKEINGLIRGTPMEIINDSDITNISNDILYVYYLWASGAEYREICGIYDFYIGDFTKDILKLCSILEKLCIVYSEYDLKIYSIIKDYRNKLIRSIVTTESLYINIQNI